MRRRLRLADEQGYTLPELLIATVIFSVVLGATVAAALTAIRAERTATATRVSMDSGRVAVDRIQGELRHATRIEKAASNSDVLSFWVDENDDGFDQQSELVFFGLNTADPDNVRLERWIATAPATRQVVAQHLEGSGPAFSYDPPLPAAPREVTMSFLLGSGLPREEITLDTSLTVHPRNIAPPSLTIANVTLIDADSDTVVSSFDPIQDGDAIPADRLNIRANPADPANDIQSVKFVLSGPTPIGSQVENEVPFAMKGNTGTDYHAWTPAPGSYTLTATAYDGANASGVPGPPYTISFTVVS